MAGIKHFFSDSRFWILLSFILRLYHITNPPLEVVHNWRQTTVTMPARNFVETGPDILFPKVDFAGDKTGITGMEFPLLNYFMYLVSLVFGYAHWYGRLINLIFSTVGLLFFHRLIKKYFNEAVAFNSTFILIFSIWFSYSRKIMPDTFSMSLVIMGLYYGTAFLDNKASLKNIMLYALFVLSGILSKLPAGYILIILLPFLYSSNISLSRKLVFSTVSLVVVAIVSAWYFYWVPHLNKVFGFDHFFMGKSLSDGFSDIIMNFNKALEKFYRQALGFTGFIVFVTGTVVVFRKKEKKPAIVLVLCSLAFLPVVIKGGFAFYNHSYYIIPFAPVMALVCGWFISGLNNKKAAVVLLSLITIECIISNNNDFYIKEQHMAILNLEKDFDRFSKRTDLILVNSGNVPTPVYFAHRKGWIDYNENISNATYIDTLHKKGLKYIVILKRAFGTDLLLKYKQVLSNNDYTIYKL